MIWDNIWIVILLIIIAFSGWSLIRLLRAQQDSDRTKNRDSGSGGGCGCGGGGGGGGGGGDGGD